MPLIVRMEGANGLARRHPRAHRPGVWRAALPVLALALCATCAGRPHGHRVHLTTGALAGIARDLDSGDPVSAADLHAHLEGESALLATVTSPRGLYAFDQLAPGSYTLVAEFAGQPVEIQHIAVAAGETTLVDVMFTLGRPTPVVIDYAAIQSAVITRFHPAHLPAGTGLLEGFVADTTTHQRMAGAVVTAVDGDGLTQQTVSDDAGRFAFTGLVPGRYAVSAYYTVGQRAQIEVRRGDIAIGPGEGARVPLYIETAR